MNKDKVQAFAALIICILGGALIFFVFVKHLLVWLLPFLVAWGVAFAMRPLSRSLTAKLHIPERILRAILSVLLITVILSIGGVLVWQLVGALWRFLSDISESDALYNFFAALINPTLGVIGNISLPSELATELDGAFRAAITSILSGLGSVITEWASFIPRIFIAIVITFIATVYFAYGLEEINKNVKKYLPKSLFSMLVKIKNGFICVGIKYIRAYSLIMLITFAIMLVGFFILRVEHAALIALIVAFLDFLPVIGVGTVLVPWSIFQLVCGNHFLGIGLIILLLVNEIVRQFSEPKIIGKNLNIHPLLTLFLIYVGYALFGFVGLILLPCAAVLVNILFIKNDSSEVE